MTPSRNNSIFHHAVCRPALPLDTQDMLELTSQIWEGDDYIPKVWQEWLFDPQGLLAVAEFRGKIVGIGKLTRLSKQDWWLEGLRVHPEFEGQRIASLIQTYLLEVWEKIGSGMLRFATLSSREPVKHLAHVNGFHMVGEYSTFKAPSSSDISKNEDPFSQIDPHENEAVVDWLTAPPGEKLAFGLMNLGWQFAPPKQEYLTEYLKKDLAWWWHQDRGLLILVEKRDGVEIWGRVRMLACATDGLVDFLADTNILAARLGYAGITWLAPLTPGIENLALQAGFKRDWESSLLIFEKSVSG